MATNTKKKGVIFIEKNAFYYFDETRTNVLQYAFPPNLVQDLEIFDKEALETQIKTFIDTNKIFPANLMLVISDSIIFEKMVPLTDNSKKDQEVQNFLENIPFENIIYKVYDQDKGYKIIAFNKEIFTSLKSAFETPGFTVSGVIPNFILGNMGSSGTLQINTVKFVLSKFDMLQKESLVIEPVKPNILDTDILNLKANENNETEEEQFTTTRPPVKKNSTLPYLSAVFFVLFIVLGIVIYMQFQQNKKPSPVPSTIVAPSLAPSPSPTIEIEPTTTSTPSATPTKSK